MNSDQLTRDYLAAMRSATKKVIAEDERELRDRTANDSMLGEIMLELRESRRLQASYHQGHSLSFGGCGTVRCETCREAIT